MDAHPCDERSMRVAVDCRMINHSGIGTLLRELLPHFLSSDHQFILLGNALQLAQFERMGCTVVDFPSPIYSIQEHVKFPRWSLNQVDVLLCPHYNVPLTANGRVVVVICDLAHLALPEIFRGVGKRIYAHVFYRYAVKRAARIITISEFTRSEMSRRLGVDPAGVEVIHCGPGRSFPEPADLSAARLERYGVEPPYVLAVGNLKPHKNFAILIEAFRRLSTSGNPARKLVVAGKAFEEVNGRSGLFGYSRAELEAQGIVLAGYVEDADMPTLYHHAGLFVLPSLYEGFGLPPLEALRFGTLPLVSDCASLPEVIDDAELRFNPQDAGELAARISFFLDHDDAQRAKLEEQQERARRFSWDKAARSFLQVVEQAGKSRGTQVS